MLIMALLSVPSLLTGIISTNDFAITLGVF